MTEMLADPAYMGLLEALDELREQIGDLQAWNRDLQVQLDGLGKNTLSIRKEMGDLGEWLGEVADDMLDRAGASVLQLAVAS